MPAPTSQAPPAPAELAQVRVIDGDTFRIEIDGQDERVRLVGIDTPESGECLADAAGARLAELLLDAVAVDLIVDVSDRDRFGRLLRLVETSAGLVNEVLVEEGLAIARSYPPDTGHDDVFAEAQQRAQAGARGIWSGDACGQPADASLAVVDFNANPDGDDTLVPNEEWVVIANQGSAVVSMAGWTLRDESASKRFDFPDDFALSGGGEVKIHTGCGIDADRDLYWCVSGSAVWNNSGDTAFLLDPSGNLHHWLGY